MVRCPNADKAVSTGIHCDIRQFSCYADHTALSVQSAANSTIGRLKDAWLRGAAYRDSEQSKRLDIEHTTNGATRSAARLRKAPNDDHQLTNTSAVGTGAHNPRSSQIATRRPTSWFGRVVSIFWRITTAVIYSQQRI